MTQRIQLDNYRGGQGFRPSVVQSNAEMLRQNLDVELADMQRETEMTAERRRLNQQTKKVREEMETAFQMKELKEFSGTLMKLVEMAAGEIVKGEKVRAMMDHRANPNLEDLAKHSDQEAALEEQSNLANDAAAETVEKLGPGVIRQRHIEKLRSSTGHYAYERLKLFLQATSAQYPQIVKERLRNGEYDQSLDISTYEGFKGALNQIDSELSAPVRDINPEMRAKYWDPNITKGNQKILADFEKGLDERLSFNSSEDNFRANMMVPGANIATYITKEKVNFDKSGSPKGYKGALSQLIIHGKRMIDLGLWTSPDQIDKYFNKPIREVGGLVRVNKKGEALTYFSEYQDRVLELKEYLTDKEQADFKDREKREQRARSEDEQRVVAQGTVEGWPERRWKEEERNYHRKHGVHSSEIAAAAKGLATDVTAREAQRDALIQMVREGRMTRELAQQIKDPIMRREIMGYLESDDNPLKDKTFVTMRKSIEGELRRVHAYLPQQALGGRAAQALIQLDDIFMTHFNEFKDKMGIPAAASAAQHETLKFYRESQEDKLAPLYKGNDLQNLYPNLFGSTPRQREAYNKTIDLLHSRFDPLREATDRDGKKVLQGDYKAGLAGGKEELIKNARSIVETGNFTNPMVDWLAHNFGEGRFYVLQQMMKQHGENLQDYLGEIYNNQPKLTPQAEQRINDPSATKRQVSRTLAPNHFLRPGFSPVNNITGMPNNSSAPMIGLLFGGESDSVGGWYSWNAGRAGDRPGMEYAGMRSMSIGDVMADHAAGKLFAAGGLQITPNALIDAQKHLKLDPSTPYTPQVQQYIVIFGLLANPNKRPQLAKFLNGESDDIRAAHYDLSLEYSSVAMPGTTRTAHPQGGNKAHITDERRIHHALYELRKYVMSFKQQGMI